MTDEWLDPLDDLRTAFAMIREALEEYGPVTAGPSPDGVLAEYGPRATDEARALIDALHRLAPPP